MRIRYKYSTVNLDLVVEHKCKGEKIIFVQNYFHLDIIFEFENEENAKMAYSLIEDYLELGKMYLKLG